MALGPLSVSSSATHKQIGPFWCYFPRWVGLSIELSCEAGSFSHHRNPHRVYSQRFWYFSFPHWNPGLHGLSLSPVLPPGLSTCKCGTTQSSSHCLALHPLYPGCPSLPLLPVWMNASSLTPWVLDFHTIRFSGSSGCLLFLNLLFYFWLCEEAQCIYLCFHYGQKLRHNYFEAQSGLP